MSETEEAVDDIDVEIISTLSDYLDGALPAAARADVERKLETDEAWKLAHADLIENRKFMSGMRKAHAPPAFADEVTSTIHKRSDGRFFGKRTFGDRVPFGALLIVALLGLGVIAYVLWSSSTGSLKVDREHGAVPGSAAPLVPSP